ncbi:polyprotein [Pyrus ussuriensis x Pyrus communis]|uniref:Polyprotein n=1 Tax=Pyrus ussuriensis x Pyrus communis TaxID=2448454 RepID=A0A5N5HBA0_9ROSA|nr:polyprotein [Pyrus ussuriensis x Pyrus communis]
MTAALRMLAYGASADQVDEITRMGKSTILESLMRFCGAIESIYTAEYLWKPTNMDLQRLLKKTEMRGFPGMIGSIDCMHWTPSFFSNMFPFLPKYLSFSLISLKFSPNNCSFCVISSLISLIFRHFPRQSQFTLASNNFQRLDIDSLVLFPTNFLKLISMNKTPHFSQLHLITRKRTMSNFNPASTQRNIFKKQPIRTCISKFNLVDGSERWWVDTSAFRHVCYDRSLFKTYSVTKGRNVLLGDSHSTDVVGIGEVELKFTFGKTMILKYVMHAPAMSKNLVSGFLLNKVGLTQTIGADMYTLTKNGVFVGNGYTTNGMFKLNFENNTCSIICLYVDDLLVFGSNIHVVNNVKSLLCATFDMKDLGEASVILGLKITRFENGVSLDQSHYIEKVLRKYNYFDCKPACTPYDPSVKLFKNTGDSVKQSEYASIIGSLHYATNCTRPDISYAFPIVLEGYNDANWNTLSNDSKATNGYIFSIELIVLATTSKEAGWLRNLLSDTPLWEKPIPTVLILYDSTLAIAKVQNHYYNEKMRQVCRKHNTIRNYLSNGAVRVDHIQYEENLVDHLTK